MQGADWEAQLQGAILVSRAIAGRRLSARAVAGRRLSRAQLQGAALSGAQLQGAKPQPRAVAGRQPQLRAVAGRRPHEAQLQGADLSQAQLQGADLSRARLQGAELAGGRSGGGPISTRRWSSGLTLISQEICRRRQSDRCKSDPVTAPEDPSSPDLKPLMPADIDKWEVAATEFASWENDRNSIAERFARLKPGFQTAQQDAADRSDWSELR